MEIKNYFVFYRYCFVANIFLFFGLLTNDRIYIDDIGRSVSGYFIKWTEVGRPLANVFMYLLHLGSILNNMSPFPQIISILIISSGCVYLAKFYNVKSPFFVSLCTLPFAGQPYFLQNMSYNYDSPTMALGLVLSVIAAIQLINKKRGGFILSIALLFLALNLYQPTVGAFFVTYMFLLINNVDIKVSPKTYFWGHFYRLVLCSLISFLLYMPLIRIFIKGDYAIAHSKFVGLSGVHDKILTNCIEYYDSIIKDWSGSAIGYIFVILFISSLIITVLNIVKKPNNKFNININTIVYSIICIIITVLTVFASYFPQMFLENPIIVPRVFVGIGPLLSCCCLSIYSYMESNGNTYYKYKQHITSIFICIVAYALISFTYSYSKANIDQNKYEDMILSRLIFDADEIAKNNNIQHIAIYGSIGRSMLFKNTMKKYPLMDALVPIDVEDWHVGYSKLNYMGLNLKGINIKELDKAYIINNSFPVVNNSKYAIYLIEKIMLIKFYSQ